MCWHACVYSQVASTAHAPHDACWVCPFTLQWLAIPLAPTCAVYVCRAGCWKHQCALVPPPMCCRCCCCRLWLQQVCSLIFAHPTCVVHRALWGSGTVCHWDYAAGSLALCGLAMSVAAPMHFAAIVCLLLRPCTCCYVCWTSVANTFPTIQTISHLHLPHQCYFPSSCHHVAYEAGLVS